MVIIQLTYTVPTERIDELLEAHRAFLRKGYENKQFVMSGPQRPRVGGIIIADVGSIEEAEAIIHEDPFYVENAATYEFLEFAAIHTDERIRGLFKY